MNTLESLQPELAALLESLSGEARTALERDIATQDFDMLAGLVKEHSERKLESTGEDEILPMQFPHSEVDLRREMWEVTGKNLLKRGEVAAFTLAGGQGSRLGFEGPKGAFKIGLPSGNSLFGLMAERLRRLSAEAERHIPWCIMTSPLNHRETIAHFEENHFFGLNREYIRFFEQGTICALTPDGKAVVENNRLALVPDGNGGCFRALAQSGSLAWLIEKGVRYVFLHNVDNALIRTCDPVFLGALASNSATQISAKVVSKRDENEKVGIFAYKNKKPTVIEYSDMSDELRTMKNAAGELMFDGANIGIYAFRIEVLKKLSQTPLPWHAARKTVNGIEKCWKFEQFLFDAFSSVKGFGTFGAFREDEFAPVKNAEGNDSPASAREMLGKLHRHWLREAHAKPNEEKFYEISPALSYAGEGLSEEIFKRELGKNILEF